MEKELGTQEASCNKLALRPREAAVMLSISQRLLWQLTKDGDVPCVRLGQGKRRTVLYVIRDLETWLASRSQVEDERNSN